MIRRLLAAALVVAASTAPGSAAAGADEEELPGRLVAPRCPRRLPGRRGARARGALRQGVRDRPRERPRAGARRAVGPLRAGGPLLSLLRTGAKDYDLALSQITITDARDTVVDFSRLYLVADQAVLCAAGSRSRQRRFSALRELPPLRRPGRNQRGQGQADPARARGPRVRRRVPARGGALTAALRRGDRQRRPARRAPHRRRSASAASGRASATAPSSSRAARCAHPLTPPSTCWRTGRSGAWPPPGSRPTSPGCAPSAEGREAARHYAWTVLALCLRQSSSPWSSAWPRSRA